MSEPIRVLLVDDEPSIRESLAWYLEDRGFEPRTAGDATEALRLLATGSFQVAVVDMRLAGSDGEALILRAHQISPGTAYLVYTGSMDYRPSAELKKIGVGPEHVFIKPISDLAGFVETIRRAGEKGGGPSGSGTSPRAT